ncbi:MAG: hypothetical protein JW774_04810 [Candidatus Aureabacteria bacterium]|nr:hypothetical protein [Candidatus Auribacterota bacterium]
MKIENWKRIHADRIKKGALSFSVIVILSSAIYFFFAPSLSLSYFWDDYYLIKDNPYLNDCGQISNVFTDQGITSGTEQGFDKHIFRPLRTIYFILLTYFFGKSEITFHFFNIIWHFTVSFFFWLTLRKQAVALNQGLFLSFFFSFLFLFHPIHLENINTINGCGDMMGTLLFLLAFRQIRNTSGNIHHGRMFFILLACYLAMLCKEIFITCPVILWILFRNKFSTLQALALLMLSVLYLIQREAAVGMLAQREITSLPDHFIYILQTLFYYLFYFFFPLNLSLLYLPQEGLPGLIISLALFAAILAYTITVFIRKNETWIYPGAFLISTLPIVNLIPINTFINDRLFYFPSLIGLLSVFMIISREKSLVIFFSTPLMRRLCLLLLSVIYLTGFNRNQEWKDPALLWQKTWEKTNHPTALWNMTCALLDGNRSVDLLNFFKTTPVTLTENYIPYYYDVLCLVSGLVKNEDDFWSYYQALKEANKGSHGERFLSEKDWKDFADFVKKIPSPTARRIIKDMEENKPGRDTNPDRA